MGRYKFTEGPWHVINYGGFHAIQSEPFYGDTDLLDEDKTENAQANARLAAAAPDLLKALEDLYFVSYAGNCKTIDEVMNRGEESMDDFELRIIAAIKKARE
jgi:hypothetical protein